MSKALFSTLSILALLLSGINCATGKRGGGGGGSPTCTVGLVLKLGDECSGPNYKIRNNGGDPLVTGSYRDSRSTVKLSGDEKLAINNGTYRFINPGLWLCDDLELSGKDGNAWIIKSLPTSTPSMSPTPSMPDVLETAIDVLRDAGYKITDRDNLHFRATNGNANSVLFVVKPRNKKWPNFAKQWPYSLGATHITHRLNMCLLNWSIERDTYSYSITTMCDDFRSELERTLREHARRP